ncbi:YrdB family protein [Phytomonospora sp. NPDC050363]|uniref:YrdB family protein n=1 Tax=Phytomonospora sp. NPDC050363 TaxID=3155642 RepID=UPI0033E8B420
MPLLKTASATLFFVLELCTYAAALWWSFTVPPNLLTKAAAALGSLVVLIGVWSTFGAPKAAHHLTGGWRAALLVLWFGSGALALVGVGRPGLAVAFGALAVLAGAADLAWSEPK